MNRLNITSGLMIAASIIALYFGIIFLSGYTNMVNYYANDFYPDLYIAILSLLAFLFGLTGAALLLTKKNIRLSLVCIIIVLLSGLAMPIVYAIEGYLWQNGLLLGSPMIVLAIIALTIVYSNNPKLHN